MNDFKDDMIIYFNILVENQATKYTRTHYTLIDLLKEQGGLQKMFALFAFILMRPFIFKQHDLKVFQDHVYKHDKDHKLDQSYVNDEFLRRNRKFYLPTEFYVYL